MRIIFIVFALALTAESKACGNFYYYVDKPMPYKNGFLDYEKIFNVYDDAHSRLAYFFPAGVVDNGIGTPVVDQGYSKLRDTLCKITGLQNDWRVSNMEIVKKAVVLKIDYKLLSDFAWMLARRNELTEAEKLLLTLEKKNPGEYNIVANLGTVYELLGQPKLALRYITKAIEISPGGHYGSEWLHINILRMKIGEIKAYDFTDLFEMYPEKPGFTNTVYGDGLYYENLAPTSFGRYHRDTLMVHIAYQLHERMLFISRPDRIMAELHYMFLQCMVHRQEYDYAAEAARLCAHYSEPHKISRIFELLDYCIED